MTAEKLTAGTEAGDVVVRCGGRPVVTYCRTPRPGPTGTPPLFTRSGYLHPIHAPCGAVVTDDFAADHPHQRGVFFAWTKTQVTLDGTELHPDFWNLGSGTGRVRAAGGDEPRITNGRVHLRTRQVWDLKHGDAWIEALHETWDIIVYPPEFTAPQAPGAAYMFDLISRQTPAMRLELPAYRYGGMAVRGAAEWIPKASGVAVTDTDGHTRITADGAKAGWCALSGPVRGNTAGIALFEHPDNPRTPNPLRVHPEVPYFVFCPSKNESWALEKGREQVFRFRVIAANAAVTVAQGNNWWNDFAAGFPR